MKRIFGSDAEMYKDFVISRSWGAPGSIWEYVHKDYDGPEDNRCGHAGSIEEAKTDIDERFYEE